MNVQRFISLPNIIKPILLLLLILVMIICGATSTLKPAVGNWFFWLTTIAQLIIMSGVVVAFFFEMELVLTCGRDHWPVVEMAYSAVFGVCGIINMFIVANWNKIAYSHGPFIVAALFIFGLVILYGLNLIMFFRIWRGFVTSGASQNPSGNVQPGNTGNMHPGI
ncbi:hypothetical protein M3Y97_00567500 [Aphelenchoides bicaudatus]|nr:hypothetical protein M3Y97_00567500 [Aphelenchoides bicaudatus]